MIKKIRLINDEYGSKYGFHDPETAVKRIGTGITEETVRQISREKNEPEWMLNLRLKAFKIFMEKTMPKWGPDIKGINFNSITYYLKSSDKKANSWNEVPAKIKETFNRLGLPEAEQKFLGGVGAQYESESVYHHIREDLKKEGVIFLDTDSALKNHEALLKRYFGRVVPPTDNKFAALNSAMWSGGTFIYIPKGVKVKFPLHAYFRMNAQRMGQFERTLIIVDEDAELHYIEGCTAPIYSQDSLHAAVVEVIALKRAKVRYTTIQNWSTNIYNLVTKRSHAHEDALVEWIDGNLGSKTNMKYPSVFLIGKNSKANILSVAYAGKGQNQDAGGKVIHCAPNTTSRIISKSISKDGGISSYRGMIKINKGAVNARTSVKCDALLLDDKSVSNTYPLMIVDEKDSTAVHEAYVGKISEEQLFYLKSRGLSENDATSMIVLGFISEFTKELPAEYSVELNSLMEYMMER